MVNDTVILCRTSEDRENPETFLASEFRIKNDTEELNREHYGSI